MFYLYHFVDSNFTFRSRIGWSSRILSLYLLWVMDDWILCPL